jgi:hypothetical protein
VLDDLADLGLIARLNSQVVFEFWPLEEKKEMEDCDSSRNGCLRFFVYRIKIGSPSWEEEQFCFP